jgi:hypothetical protein
MCFGKQYPENADIFPCHLVSYSLIHHLVQKEVINIKVSEFFHDQKNRE